MEFANEDNVPRQVIYILLSLKAAVDLQERMH